MVNDRVVDTSPFDRDDVAERGPESVTIDREVERLTDFSGEGVGETLSEGDVEYVGVGLLLGERDFVGSLDSDIVEERRGALTEKDRVGSREKLRVARERDALTDAVPDEREEDFEGAERVDVISDRVTDTLSGVKVGGFDADFVGDSVGEGDGDCVGFGDLESVLEYETSPRETDIDADRERDGSFDNVLPVQETRCECVAPVFVRLP
jgi:hypothetical protein